MLDRLAIGRRRNRGAMVAASGRAAVDRWSAASSASGIGQRILRKALRMSERHGFGSSIVCRRRAR